MRYANESALFEPGDAMMGYASDTPAQTSEAAGGDVFVLARIAGHSSITITQRYVHPQADAINRVFTASQVGTKLGTIQKRPKNKKARVRKQLTLESA